jgi:hypothetical protein
MLEKPFRIRRVDKERWYFSAVEKVVISKANAFLLTVIVRDVTFILIEG